MEFLKTYWATILCAVCCLVAVAFAVITRSGVILRIAPFIVIFCLLFGVIGFFFSHPETKSAPVDRESDEKKKDTL